MITYLHTDPDDVAKHAVRLHKSLLNWSRFVINLRVLFWHLTTGLNLGVVRLQLQIESEGFRTEPIWLKSDSGAIVRSIWWLSDLKLLQIGKRVKATSYTVYRIWSFVYARSTTPRDMASLPTPIATLQSQPHVFYDALILTFVIAIILLPRGVRT